MSDGNEFDLSTLQRGIWAGQALDPSSSAYVTAQYTLIEGPIDGALFEAASRMVIAETEALGLRFSGPIEHPLQAIVSLRSWSLPVVDLTGSPDPDGAAACWMAERRARTFDLGSGPIFSWALLVLGPARFIWSFLVHHLGMDAFSRAMTVRRLAEVYAALAKGEPVPPCHSGSLRELYAEEQVYRASARYEDDRRYFRQQLAERPQRVSLSSSSNLARYTSFRASATLPRVLADRLRALVPGASLAQAITAAAGVFQAQRKGGDDLLLGFVLSARTFALARNTPSTLSNILPLRLLLSRGLTASELVQRSGRAIRELLRHQRYPSADLRRDLRLSPVTPDPYGITVNVIPFEEGATFASFPATTHNLSNGPVGDLTVGVFDSPERPEPRLDLNGNSELYDEASLRVHLDDLLRLLGELAEGGATRTLGALLRESPRPVVAPIAAEGRAQLALWNATAADYPRDQPLTALLRAQAERSPFAIALEAGDARLTYAELFRRAGAVAARLEAAGVRPDARVGLYLDRHETLVEAMLGILEAGGGYLPLDPALPKERLAFMLEDAGVQILLTRRALLGTLPPHTAQVICLDDELRAGLAASGRRPAGASSLAYVLYTSGSTGKPKGVEVEHRQLVNFLYSMARSPGLDASDVLLAVTSVSFDIAGLELWLPLLRGARICLAGHEEAADGTLLQQALARSRATVLQATPSTWRALFASGWAGDPRLKALVGGEALPPDLAERLSASCREAWNLYGPTETTIWSSAWKIPKTAAPVRVGRPIANTQLHVLDGELREQPIGETGELFIGGEGVARGYLGRPELNAERFLPDPFRGGDARMYRTGDLARWMHDGTVDLLGRNDDQLKLRGHRIEAGEVEAALMRLPDIVASAVALHSPETGDSRLVAYLVPRQGATLPPSTELRARLRQWLAEYTLPYHFVELPKLPLTPNGKVDRRQLSALFRPHLSEAAEEAEAPRVAELQREFADLLGCKVAADTDFFEAGGDSLAALRLLARLSAKFPGRVTTSDLFLHSTPASLAHHLQALEADSAPLFLVHPVGGQLESYVGLAAAFDRAIPLFGLRADRDEPLNYASIEERCAAYAEELQHLPAGPIFLCGYSLGGVLAMEIAAQLRRAGRQVSSVFLLDSWVPRPARSGLARARHRLVELRRFGWEERRGWLLAQLRRFTGRERREELMLTLGQQAPLWRPSRYEGNVVVFRCEIDVRGRKNPLGALGWDAFCPNLEVVTVPGDHNQIVAGPAARVIVREMELRMGGHPSVSRGAR
jgi:enterobactin synthetase component F